jgi:hypothetical protein
VFTSRTIRQLSLVTATLAALLACSPAPSGPSTDLGVFEVDGPVQIDLTFDAIPYRSTPCDAMSPSVSLSWTGEEAPVALDVSLRNTDYQEDALATDGEVITVLTGRWSEVDDERCRFDATVVMTSEEPLVGSVRLHGRVEYVGRGSAEGLEGAVTVVPLES